MFSRKASRLGLPSPNHQQSAPLVPRTTERSNESAAGPLYTASDLANVLDLSEEQLRGVSTTTLLQGFGRLFAENGAVARADPQGTFELSRPVKQLDYFVSHAWRTSRWPKFLALLLYFNFWSGVAAYCVAAYVSFWFLTFFFESLPPMYVFAPAPSGYDASEMRSTWLCATTSSVAFLVGLVTAHWWRDRSCFLDVACIDQLDATKKAKGISALGALLDRSERMVVILDEHYMTRIWCIFELAAFAKRSSMSRCDLVPLHVALQRAALTLVVIIFPLLTLSMGPIISALPNDVGFIVMLPIFAVMLSPPYVLLLYAMNQGRGTALALQRLKDFKLSDAECFSEEDRVAIVSLIARWFGDASLLVENADASRQRAVGIHHFEQFIRRDVVAKLDESLGRGGALWPQDFSLLFFLALGGGMSLDVLCAPEFGMYLVLPHAAQQLTVFLVGAPIFGWGAARAADATFHVQQAWRWGACAAYLFVGIPIVVVAFGIALGSTALINPYMLFVGTDTDIGRFMYPDDGLEPFGRALLKVQVVSIAFGCAMGLARR